MFIIIQFNEKGFEKVLKNIREVQKLIDIGEYNTAKRRIEDIEAILMANKDNKVKKNKKIWDDERWD